LVNGPLLARSTDRRKVFKVCEKKMKTKIRTYSFDLNKVGDREPYHQLNARLSAEVKAGKRGHCLNTIATHDHEARVWGEGVKNAEASGVLTLETEHLFENQWNSAEAGRVFDWYEGINFNNRLLKFGHYLEITPEMEAVRHNTVACGYTGHQFPAEGAPVFNVTERGLASYGLKESELHMLRLLPIWPENQKRAPLTPEEREYLLPLYVKAREKVNAAAREKQRAEVEAEYKRDSARAEMEYNGKIWLLDRGLSLENVIFYNHTERFSFGWRTPYGPTAALSIADALQGFPFAYDIQQEGTK
jgi:hypothetical protein